MISPTQRAAARLVGILYLVQMAAGVFGEVVVRGQLIVRGDAAQTAKNIIASEQLFRLSIAGDLLTCIAVLVLTWGLYVLLRPVNQHLALLGAFFRLVELAVLSTATVSSLVVLRLLGSSNPLPTFEAAQIHSLVSLAIANQRLAMSVAFVFLGLGSAVFAWLLLKSRYVPKALAALGIFGALTLSIVTLAIIVFPGLRVLGMIYMLPMGLYEVGLGLWLLIKGLPISAPNES
ncbi:MAG: DUF4386 domain-containing protein [Spartobacteria bacterium]